MKRYILAFFLIAMSVASAASAAMARTGDGRILTKDQGTFCRDLRAFAENALLLREKGTPKSETQNIGAFTYGKTDSFAVMVQQTVDSVYSPDMPMKWVHQEPLDATSYFGDLTEDMCQKRTVQATPAEIKQYALRK